MGTELAVSAMLHQQQTLSQLRHTRCCTCTRKPAGIGTLVEVDYNMYSCCMCSAASCAPGSQLLWLPDACPARELASNTSITYAFTMLRIVQFTWHGNSTILAKMTMDTLYQVGVSVDFTLWPTVGHWSPAHASPSTGIRTK